MKKTTKRKTIKIPDGFNLKIENEILKQDQKERKEIDGFLPCNFHETYSINAVAKENIKEGQIVVLKHEKNGYPTVEKFKLLLDGVEIKTSKISGYAWKLHDIDISVIKDKIVEIKENTKLSRDEFIETLAGFVKTIW